MSYQRPHDGPTDTSHQSSHLGTPVPVRPCLCHMPQMLPLPSPGLPFTPLRSPPCSVLLSACSKDSHPHHRLYSLSCPGLPCQPSIHPTPTPVCVSHHTLIRCGSSCSVWGSLGSPPRLEVPCGRDRVVLIPLCICLSIVVPDTVPHWVINWEMGTHRTRWVHGWRSSVWGKPGLQTSLMMTMNLGGDKELRVPRDWGLFSPLGGVREAFREATLEFSS